MNTKLLSTDRPIALYYALLSEIVSYTVAGAAQCTVVLSAPWKLIHTTIGTIDVKESPEEAQAGIKHITQINAVCPGHGNQVSDTANSIQGRKLILKVVYRSGIEKIIGNKSMGPKLFFPVLSAQTTDRRLESKWENTGPNLYHT